VDNRDPFHHTFAIEELGIEVDLPANTARDVPLDGASPGVYTFVCTVVGHETMTGTIEVTE
ncbi:MAG TPA: cupredoxin domain-containing protein, partial [Nitriliruptoraceae bacterium]|nr:cupredoxin domain-containing protein [Nitriliruptoraceae bacterium]